MRRSIKLLILLLLSLSVYFIYGKTKNHYVILTNLGDGLGMGINSYGIEDYNAIEQYQDYLKKEKKAVLLYQEFSKKNIRIKELIEKIKNTPELKRELLESHILFLTIGYYDFYYDFHLEEDKEKYLEEWEKEFEKNYQELIQEIRKYYKKPMIGIGYYERTDNILEKKAIHFMNQVIKNQENMIYISTEFLLEEEKEYFSNPKSYYPNRLGYQQITNKIIENT